MTGPYAVDPAGLAATGGTVGGEGDAIASAVGALNSALSGSGAMFGHDAAGIVFGNNYTQSGKALLDAAGSAVNACRRVGFGVQMSAANYGRANAASTVGGGSPPVAPPSNPTGFEAPSMPPPMGSGVAAPLGWTLVEAFVGDVWPDGNPEALRAAAGAWRTFGAAISGIAGQVGATGPGLGGQQIPEAGRMSAAVTNISNALTGIAGQAQELATQVEGFAATVETTQNAVRGLLEQLSPGGILETIGGVFTGHNPIDKIKQIANEIKTVLNNMKREADASSQLFSQGINVLDSLTGDFQSWAKKEFVDVLGEEVGNPLATVFNGVVGANKSGFETVLRTVNGLEGFDPTRFAYDPEGALHMWNAAAQNMADMANPAALATHMMTDPQGVLDEAKNLVDYKDWASGHYADAVGNISANIAMTVFPVGAEARPAVTAAEMESRAASAAAQAEGRTAAGGARDAASAATHAASATEGITTKAGQIGGDLDKVNIPESGAAPGSAPPTGHAPVEPPRPEAVPHTETPTPRVDAPAPHAPAEPAPHAPAEPAPHAQPEPARTTASASPHDVPSHASEPAPVQSSAAAVPRVPEPAMVGAAPAEAPAAAAPHASAPVGAPAEMPATASAAPHVPSAPAPQMHTPTAEAPHAPPADHGSPAVEQPPHGSAGGSEGIPSDHGAPERPAHDGADPPTSGSNLHEPPSSGTHDLNSDGHHDPIHNGQESGPGWHRLPDEPIVPHYGEPLSSHWEFPHDPLADINPQVGELITDPAAPYGRGPDGVAYTSEQYSERFNSYGPDGQHYQNYPNNDGAVPGSKVAYDDPYQFTSDYGDKVDRIGGDGKYLAVMEDANPAPWEQRGMHVNSLGDPYNSYTFDASKLPPGWKVEVSEIAPATGQPGGGIQVRVLDSTNSAVPVSVLKDPRVGVLR
ncbi:glycohydrolase toxin TNT-related protein [Mycobacterium sp.]|uniref:glycohydrolase toxin TNT-related protein n=1 Tax=Mycobacterium sp. TaxID=1785 RepID=UPI002C5A8B06|nr:glycohydrolase toxin TNT-related protein [Mycobacterium sp.]HKP44399.1 glycohydrolase toxin TNT-related protein [Mycobacterium sp.]